jgi:biopolymer transport protein ExbD
MGMISDPKELSNTLRTVFTKRENSGILREGTNEVEKTVFLKVEGACKYGDMIRLVDAVRLAGGEPIGILFEEPVIPTPDKDALR